MPKKKVSYKERRRALIDELLRLEKSQWGLRGVVKHETPQHEIYCTQHEVILKIRRGEP